MPTPSADECATVRPVGVHRLAQGTWRPVAVGVEGRCSEQALTFRLTSTAALVVRWLTRVPQGLGSGGAESEVKCHGRWWALFRSVCHCVVPQHVGRGITYLSTSELSSVKRLLCPLSSRSELTLRFLPPASTENAPRLLVCSSPALPVLSPHRRLGMSFDRRRPASALPLRSSIDLLVRCLTLSIELRRPLPPPC